MGAQLRGAAQGQKHSPPYKQSPCEMRRGAGTMPGRCPGAGQAPRSGEGQCKENLSVFRVQPQGWEGAQGQADPVASPRRPRRPQGSLLRGQLRLFLPAFFQKSEPAVVRVLRTVSDVLQRLGAYGVGAQSLGVARNARSLFDDVSAPRGRAGPPHPQPLGGETEARGAPWVCARADVQGGELAARGRSALPRVQSPTTRGPHLPQGLSADQDWFPFPGKLEDESRPLSCTCDTWVVSWPRSPV